MLIAYKRNNKGIICAFTGCGKSRVIYEIAIDRPNDNILIVFPSLILLDQFIDLYAHRMDNVLVLSSIHKKTKMELDIHHNIANHITLTTY